MHDESIGARIASERKLRGLTQLRLAEKAAVSVSLLRKVEQGARPVTYPLVSAVAVALGVDRLELTGQPYRSGSRTLDAVHDLVPDIRRELVAYRQPPSEERGIPTLAELQAGVTAISYARHKVDLLSLGALLPLVLGDLRAATWGSSGADREQIMRLTCETYYACRQFLHKLGHADLASLVADRYEWAAEQSGDPLTLALAGVFRAGELDQAADPRGARQVMANTIEGLEVRDDPDGLSVEGFVHLMAGYMAAHAGDTDATWSHYAAARELAQRLGSDGDAYRLAFGPTNVAIWGTALGVELGDGAKAIEHAKKVHLTKSTPPERAGHYYIDLARARQMSGDREGVLEALLNARRIAPQQTRYHPMAREALLSLARAERRSSESVRGLAVWMGVPD